MKLLFSIEAKEINKLIGGANSVPKRPAGINFVSAPTSRRHHSRARARFAAGFGASADLFISSVAFCHTFFLRALAAIAKF